MSLPRIPATWVWGLVSELRAGMRRVADMRKAAWLPHTSTMLSLLIRHRYQLDKRLWKRGSVHRVCACVCVCAPLSQGRTSHPNSALLPFPMAETKASMSCASIALRTMACAAYCTSRRLRRLAFS